MFEVPSGEEQQLADSGVDEFVAGKQLVVGVEEQMHILNAQPDNLVVLRLQRRALLIVTTRPEPVVAIGRASRQQHGRGWPGLGKKGQHESVE